jgi:hypothetical protein
VQQLGRTHRSNQKQPPRYIILHSDVAGVHRFAAAVAKRLEQLGALTHGDRRAACADALASFNVDDKCARHIFHPWAAPASLSLPVVPTCLVSACNATPPYHRLHAKQPCSRQGHLVLEGNSSWGLAAGVPEHGVSHAGLLRVCARAGRRWGQRALGDMYRVIMGRSLPPAAVTPAWLQDTLDEECLGQADTEARRTQLLQVRCSSLLPLGIGSNTMHAVSCRLQAPPSCLSEESIAVSNY